MEPLDLRPRTLVVIPTYEERDSIGALLDAVLHHTAVLGGHVLVVDDNSPDGTAEAVRAHPAYGTRVLLLPRPGKAGLGSAYRAGFGWALEEGYDVVVQIDADGSHPADRIPALVAALADHDLAIGSRYVPGAGTRNWPLSRRLLSRGANLYAGLVLALGVHDATAGFRAWRRGAVGTVGLLESASEGYCFQIENTWRAVRRGLRVAEVPIVFVERAEGASKMSTAIAVEAVRRVASWRLGELTGRGRSRTAWDRAVSRAAARATAPTTTRAVTDVANLPGPTAAPRPARAGHPR